LDANRDGEKEGEERRRARTAAADDAPATQPGVRVVKGLAAVQPPLLVADEAERLDALRQAAILDTPPEAALDALARLATIVCQTPIALITLVDEQRAWFEAKAGLDVPESPRNISFCGHVDDNDLFVVKDALADDRFADNPLVNSPPRVRFYAGVPIRMPNQQTIGTLCVLDVVPRELDEDQIAALRGLGQQASVQIQFQRWADNIATSLKEAWATRVALERERALLRGVLRAATEYSIIGTDPEGTIIIFNEGAERMLGYNTDEVVGKVTPEIIHDPAEVAQRAKELGLEPGFEVFVKAARQGRGETREWTYIRKDGSRFPGSLTVTAMRDNAGSLTGFMGIARDITEERRAERERARFLIERAAREAAERAVDRLSRLHSMASALATAITPSQVMNVIIRQGMAALGAAAGAAALVGVDMRTLELVDAIGYPQDALAAWRSFPITTACPLTDAVRRSAPVLVETAEAARRYDAWMLTGQAAVVAIPILLEDGRPLGALCLSFTEPRSFKEEDRLFLLALGHQCAQTLERARLYEAEARARAEAEAANRAKDEFLSTLSHELRTPLTAVLGWVRMLQQAPQASSGQLSRGLAVIERNAMAQLRLIEDILDISRIVAGKLEIKRGSVDLAAVVRGAIDASRPAAEAAGLTLSATIEAGLGPIVGDTDRLQQVVANLLSNAIKFTPRGGRVDVRLDRFEEQARIQVMDTGEGISAEFLPHVFERFRQANSSPKRAHCGLGLGLSIARHLVEVHSGTILAESAGHGRGTTMTVLLSLDQRKEEDPSAGALQVA